MAQRYEMVAETATLFALTRKRLIHLLYRDQLCADQQVPKLKSDCDDTLPKEPNPRLLPSLSVSK